MAVTGADIELDIIDDIADDLKVKLSSEPTYNKKNLEEIIKNAVREAIMRRRYPSYYTDEQIEADLENYYPAILNISEYDFAHLGAPGESRRSENSTDITWAEREKLWAGMIPLARF